MSPAIFLDANIPIYAAGRPHSLKEPCADILLLASEHVDSFFTDAEVLQELLHRYRALRLWPQGREVFSRFADLMRERIEPVYAADVEHAASLADSHAGPGARDLLHAAVMARLGVRSIASADTGFDRLPDIERLNPAELGKWRHTIGTGTEPPA